jgi:alkanesulfonate monooxygenase SsuD/methylene tetrahydromethanopterin reductase-like flavin-dependent oxidoreductase (luciferase family)
MQFSLLFEGQVAYPSSANEQRVLRGAIDQAMLADELGFDRFYCVEHHGLEAHAHSSAPEVLLSFVAAKTKRIRVAHGVVPLPFKMNPPIRVAERTAMLDILSGGRLDVGIGRSSSAFEQKAFEIEDGVTQAEMLESARAIVAMWTEEEVEWESDILRIPRRRIRPQPVQKPHPPLAIACTKDDSFELAGRLGLGALSNAADGPNQAGRKRKIYDAARSARSPGEIIGKEPNDHFGATVFTCVLEDGKEARRLGLRGMRYFMEASRRWYAGTGDPPDPEAWEDAENESALRAMFEKAAQGSFSKEVRDDPGPEAAVGVSLANRALAADDVLDARSSAMGAPKDTIEFVERMEAAGVDECYFVIQLGGVPEAAVMESIRLIGEQVIPHFRKPAATVVSMAGRVRHPPGQ